MEKKLNGVYYDSYLKLCEWLCFYGYPVLVFESKYGKYGIATWSSKEEYPDDMLADIKGDFVATWYTKSYMPKVIKNNIVDSDRVFWWVFD